MGDWHEFESKALRKEKERMEREARRREKEGSGSGVGEKEKRKGEEIVGADQKKVKVAEVEAT